MSERGSCFSRQRSHSGFLTSSLGVQNVGFFPVYGPPNALRTLRVRVRGRNRMSIEYLHSIRVPSGQKPHGQS